MTSAQQQPSHVPVAVDRNGELHDTNAIERAPHSLVPPLRCGDCGAALEAVRAYPRRDGPRIIHVAAHYRLAPGAAHLPVCPWWTGEPQRSSDTRRVTQPPGSSLVYSLVIPGRGHGQINAWRRPSYRSNGRPAINSAASIGNILRWHGEDLAHLRVDYRGRTINWHDFLFTCEDVPHLEQLLQGDQPSHPVAVVGPIGDLTIASSGRSHRAELAEPLDPSQRVRGRSRIVIRSPNEQLLSTFDEGQAVIALGWWRLRNGDRTHSHAEVTLWVNSRWQISACETGPRARISSRTCSDGR